MIVSEIFFGALYVRLEYVLELLVSINLDTTNFQVIWSFFLKKLKK